MALGGTYGHGGVFKLTRSGALTTLCHSIAGCSIKLLSFLTRSLRGLLRSRVGPLYGFASTAAARTMVFRIDTRGSRDPVSFDATAGRQTESDCGQPRAASYGVTAG